jgi:lipopolysaccharide transport system permease protein
MVRTTKIRPHRPWARIDWRELVEYKDLLFFLVKRDFTAIYKQSILGPLWYVIQPLAMTIVFTVIFGKVAKISTEGTPPFLFYMTGMVFWGYFALSMNHVAESFLTNAAVFRKIYFPRLIVPFSLIVSNLGQFTLTFLTFLCFYGYYLSQGSPGIHPTLPIILLPAMILHTASTALGAGLILASSTVKYRDLRFALPFVSQLWLYMTPVVYPASIVPEKWRLVFALNPMAGVVELNRFAFLGTGYIQPGFLLTSFLSGFLMLILGLLAFQKVEKTFVDTI